MRLVRLEEYGLARGEVDDVEHEGAKDSDIALKVDIERLDDLPLLLSLLARDRREPRDELRDLNLDLRRVGVHQNRKHGLEATLDLIRGRGRGRGEGGLEGVGNGGANDGGELGYGREERRDLGRGPEAAEARKGRESDGHFRLS